MLCPGAAQANGASSTIDLSSHCASSHRVRLLSWLGSGCEPICELLCLKWLQRRISTRRLRVFEIVSFRLLRDLKISRPEASIRRIATRRSLYLTASHYIKPLPLHRDKFIKLKDIDFKLKDLDQKMLDHMMVADAEEDTLNCEIEEAEHYSDFFITLERKSMQSNTRARELIESYPQTADNYAKAVQALKQRYGQKDLLVEIYGKTHVSEVVQSALANQQCTRDVTLMTLMVNIMGNNGYRRVRALLDPGSQKSYILESTALEVKLKAHRQLDTEAELVDLVEKSTEIFAKAKMDLRMWQFGPIHRVKEVYSRLPPSVDIERSEEASVLGMKWDLLEDTLNVTPSSEYITESFEFGCGTGVLLDRLYYSTFMDQDEQAVGHLWSLNPADLPSRGCSVLQLKRTRWLREALRSRFRSEYLGQLVQKANERTPKLSVGDVVIVKVEDKRRLHWPMARIVELFPGRDGHSRVAKVRTKLGTLIRPVQKLYPLEVSSGDPILRSKGDTTIEEAHRIVKSTAELQHLCQEGVNALAELAMTYSKVGGAGACVGPLTSSCTKGSEAEAQRSEDVRGRLGARCGGCQPSDLQNVPYLDQSLLSYLLNPKPLHAIERENYSKLGRIYGVDPQMNEEDKISHLMKGIAEELYQALLPRDVHNTEQFVTECRRIESLHFLMKKISQLKEDTHRSHLKISLAIVLVLKTDDRLLEKPRNGRYDNKIPILTVGDPDLLKLVLIKDFHVFPDRRDIRFGKSVLDNSVGVATGADWRRIRSQITPAFSTGKIKQSSGFFQMIPLIRMCCDDLRENVQTELAASDDGEVEFNKMFGGFVIDFIARCILGTKINSLKDPSNQFVFYAKNFLSSGIPLRAKIGIMFPWLAKIFHVTIFNKESIIFFYQFIIELIKKNEENEAMTGSSMPPPRPTCTKYRWIRAFADERMASSSSSKLDPKIQAVGQGSANDVEGLQDEGPDVLAAPSIGGLRSRRRTRRTDRRKAARGGERKKSYVIADQWEATSCTTRGSSPPSRTFLAPSPLKNKAFKLRLQIFSMNYEELVAQCVGFFIAGYQSTSSTLSVCMHYLAVKPHIRARVLAEIDASLAKHKGLKESEFYTDLKFTENCIYEAIRIMPPAARLERKAVEDYQLGDIQIPKDSLISLPIYALPTDPEWFPEPFEYRPERWIRGEAKESIPQCAFMPFEWGPRNCIGMRFAMLTIKVTLVELLQAFTIEPGTSTKETFNIAPKQGHLAPDSVKLRVAPRTSC
ncbi:CYP3A4 [Cordylochernes scorpioides]|uniref:CYP3A4 n=1 Tax=Cordylochernes scorpioides TaxID=51811 RepID=A0ABY6K3P9_9ARAC|nr:CYP3A4 [Cordylochernes scorpioides]